MQCTIIFYTKYKILAKLSGCQQPKKKKPKPDFRQNGFSRVSSY